MIIKTKIYRRLLAAVVESQEAEWLEVSVDKQGTLTIGPWRGR